MKRFRKKSDLYGENTVLVRNEEVDKFFKSHIKRFPDDCSCCEMWYNLAKAKNKALLYDIYTGDVIGALDDTRKTKGGKLNLVWRIVVE